MIAKTERLREKEYNEIKKMGELAGINDLMAVYGEYERAMRISTEYLKEMGPKFTLSTTDNTT